MSSVVWNFQVSDLTKERLETSAGVGCTSFDVIGALSRFELVLQASGEAKQEKDINVWIRWLLPTGYSRVTLDFAFGCVNANGNLTRAHRREDVEYGPKPEPQSWIGIGRWVTYTQFRALYTAENGTVKFRFDVRKLDVKHNESYMLSQIYDRVVKRNILGGLGGGAEAEREESASMAHSIQKLLAEADSLKQQLQLAEDRHGALETRLALAESKLQQDQKSSEKDENDNDPRPPRVGEKRKRSECAVELEQDLRALSGYADELNRNTLKRLHMEVQKASVKLIEVLEKEEQCSICMDRAKTHMLNPCGHSFCEECLEQSEKQCQGQKTCTHCRQSYTARIRMH